MKISFYWFALSVFQALRYPYFHVGQVLGVPLKYSEQHKAQAKMSESGAETQPLSFCKTDLESSEPSMSHYQPLQQMSSSQNNLDLSTEQGLCFTTLSEGQQEPLSLVTNRQPMSWQAVGITQVNWYSLQMLE